ncbi:hypothetical protein [Pontibacter sp. H249]|uniref:hypothetical protein n=1 Tax=Pontibacter sp. H249 TaxID=3133420 RepID=UPI0030C18DBD
MKNKVFLLLILAWACSPKNEEVKDEQVDVAPQEEALDTVANTRLDAVKTDEDVITPTLPLPQPVLQLLTQKYPGYEQPVLADAASKQGTGNEQGPFIVRGDFTNDPQQDYALQLQHGKNLIIVAAIDTGNGNWSLQELKRDILFNDRGSLKSLYYLMLAEPGQELQDEESGAQIKLETEAVAVGLDDDVTVYVYRDNSFKVYNTNK